MRLMSPENLLKEERIMAVDPPVSVRTEDCWNRRLNFYTGRHLTHQALNTEQQHRSAHMAIFGRRLSPGIVYGLNIGVEPPLSFPDDPDSSTSSDSTDSNGEKTWLHVSPGLGICPDGEDVYLSGTMRIRLDRLPVMGQEPTGTAPPDGIGIIILQPVTADDAGEEESTDPCEIDPESAAFANWQLVDGCRLVWYPWPSGWSLPEMPYGHRLRNLLSYRIFETEESTANGILPWEKHGVPLALASIAPDGTISFVDRYSVARQGGSSLTRKQLSAGTGNPFLWQARMQNFHDHLQSLVEQGVAPDQAIQHFQFLPPVGLLPSEFINFNTSEVEFFPGRYKINAVPVPIEQIETVLDASASLSPFDLNVSDQMSVLVPIEQSLYEPNLLNREIADEDGIFADTISEQLKHLNIVLGERRLLRDMGPEIKGAIDNELIPIYPDVDPDTLPGEAEDIQNVEETVTYDQEIRAEVISLHQWLSSASSPLSEEEYGKLNPNNIGSDSFMGLSNFIEELEKKIEESNDRISFGFLRLQTDIYRIRQMMLGNVQATRLATSPILAGIARGETNVATQQNLQTYFDTAIKKQSPEKDDSMENGGNGNGDDGSNSETDSSSGGSGFSMPVMMMDSIPGTMYRASYTEKETTEKEPDPRMLFAKAVSYDAPKKASTEDVTMQSPIIGDALEIRSATIAERLDEPPAPETKNYAVSTKAEVLNSLSGLPLNFAGLTVSLAANDTAVLNQTEYDEWLENKEFADTERIVLQKRIVSSAAGYTIDLRPFSKSERETLGANELHLRQALNELHGTNKRPIDSEGLSGMVLAGLFDPDPKDGDEAAFLSSGVVALENTVGILRKVEGIVFSYTQVVDKCKKTLKKIIETSQAWEKDLSGTDREIAEYRHDLAVARSLLAEEQQRVNQINARRAEILENHVPFLFYIRPRTTTLLPDTKDEPPAINLHGVFKDPVPACFGQDLPVPDELHDFLDLFRDVPLKWLPHVKKLVFQIDTAETLNQTLTYTKQKAQLIISQPMLQVQPQTKMIPAKGYGKTVSKIIEANKMIHTSFMYQKANLDLKILDRLTWKEKRSQAEDILTLSDLIETGKGKSYRAQQAIQELSYIEDVAGCLYVRFGEIKPGIRLKWADKVSEFDRPISLNHLDGLPEWNKIDFQMRRDLQHLVDWLFSRIDTNVPQATSLMNDLIRVCILLASHAPVSTIISGHIPKPVSGKVGDVVDIVPDLGNIRIGMQVAIYTGMDITAKGIVEDMAKGSAQVKVTQSHEPTFQIDQGAKVTFLPSASVMMLKA